MYNDTFLKRNLKLFWLRPVDVICALCALVVDESSFNVFLYIKVKIGSENPLTKRTTKRNKTKKNTFTSSVCRDPGWRWLFNFQFKNKNEKKTEISERK